MPESEIKRDLGRAAADIDDHVARRILHRKTDPDRRRHRFFDQINFARTGVRGGFADGAFFHFGNAGRHRDDHARPRAHAAAVHFGDEMPQHRLGHFEIRDDAIFQRPHCDDVRRRAPEHALGLVAHRQHFDGAGLNRHDRGLAQHDALIFDINERVRRPEIDPDIAGEPAKKSFKHYI